MNVHSDEASVIRRSMSIEQWHQLGLQGNMLPVTITLDGDSMRPLIRRRKDPVTILPLRGNVQVGDVVLFQNLQGVYVVHRVWKIDGNMVQTLGDNCMKPDSWVPIASVWGRVVCVERFGRSWRIETEFARVCGRIWMALFPARVLYKQCRRLAGRCYRCVFPKKMK